MENAHIVKSFDEDLSRIENMILEMGGLVENQIKRSIEAMITRDVKQAEDVRASDKNVDILETQIDDLALKVLALRQPMAADLRAVICALKVASNLERIGDYAKNISKRTIVISQSDPIGSADKTIRRMGNLVSAMINDVLEAYINRDMAGADEVILRDEDVDHLHNTLFRELLTHMMEDPRNITACMHLLFIAKNIERMGDHATAVGEQVHYLVSGVLPEDERPKSDVTSEMDANAKQVTD